MNNRVCLSCKTPFRPKSARSFYCTMRCRNHRYRINPDLFWQERVEKKANGCWEYKGYRQKFGHGAMGRMLEDGSKKYVLAHRHAWELVNGPVPEGKWVCHHCDNPPCCNPDHLYLGVRADNVRDMVSRGRMQHGERTKGGKNGVGAKLTEAQVREIHSRYRRTGPRDSNISELADEYRVDYSAVQAIVSGRTWKHLGLGRHHAYGSPSRVPQQHNPSPQQGDSK